MSETEARELDIATAKAMGWTGICNEDHAAEGVGPDGERDYVPLYSQVDTHVGEMLEWSKYFYPHVYGWDAANGGLMWTAKLTNAYGDRFLGDGSSPAEALARAIAATGNERTE